MNYEDGLKAMEALVEWYRGREGQRNEATTRLHLIDSLFLGCLGWDKDSVISEEAQGREFADYTFLAPRRVLIVEAKREGNYFELPAGTARLEIQLPALVRTYENVAAALQQAAGYCQSRGVPFGAVTNGRQLIAFVATRNDGSAPLARIIREVEDARSLFCYKHVVKTVFVLQERLPAFSTIARHSFCYPPTFSTSLPYCSSTNGWAVPMAGPFC